MAVVPSAWVFLCFACTFFCHVFSLPEQSRFSFEIGSNQVTNVSRSIYANTTFSIYLQCKSPTNGKIKYGVYFAEMPCISAPLGAGTEYTYVQSEMDEENNYKMFQIKPVECFPNIDRHQMHSYLVAEYKLETDMIVFIRVVLFEATEETTLSGLIQFENGKNHLSPVDWPLLPFYGTMCFVYGLYAAVWIILCFRYLNELLRIQHWIAAVILLGMLEKAFFVAEYDSLNKTGVSVQGVLIAAELISCLKRALARMLFIVVSLGFGIVRPRLGAQLHRAVAVGFMFFVVSASDGVMRVLRHKTDKSAAILIPPLILSVIDSFICLWPKAVVDVSTMRQYPDKIFTSLTSTIRMLSLKKNALKLSLYRNFRNTLLFAVIVSLAFSVWNSKYFTFTECIRNWHHMWFQEAFWHILFSFLLLVVMFFWRPSANSKRYAYSPLVDSDDNVLFEQPSNEAYDVKKTQSGLTNNNGAQQPKANVDDDLRWVEDNIPSSVLDINLMDSDEETKERILHTSKMQ